MSNDKLWDRVNWELYGMWCAFTQNGTGTKSNHEWIYFLRQVYELGKIDYELGKIDNDSRHNKG